jgi:uncharacterized protein (TIGR02466 family)
MHDLVEHIPFITSIYSTTIMDVDVSDEILDLQQTNKILKRPKLTGFQTITFSKPFRQFIPLFEKIEPYVKTVAETWGIQKPIALKNFWINQHNLHDYGLSHLHPEGIISGVYYVQVPNNAGRIVFERPDIQESFFEGDVINQYNYKEYSVDPVVGKCILFPSYLKHRIEQNLSTEPRISLSFNYSYGQ